MKALIDVDGYRIVQFVDDNAVFPVALPLMFVDAPLGITIQHTWNGTGFDAPVVDLHKPSLQDLRNKALYVLDTARLTQAAKDPNAPKEVKDWDNKKNKSIKGKI